MRANGRNLSLIIGTKEVKCDSTSVLLDNEQADAERTTFGDVIAGADRQWFLTITGLPDYTPGTFWRLLWDLAPFTPVAYHLQPYGPGLGLPSFDGLATLDQPPPIGGDAGTFWSFTTRLTCTGEPFLAEAAP